MAPLFVALITRVISIVVLGVLLGFHQVLLQLFFGIPAAARRVTQFPGGFGSVWIQIRRPCLRRGLGRRDTGLGPLPGTCLVSFRL